MVAVTAPASDLVRHILYPSPQAAEARLQLKRERACREAQRRLVAMQRRLTVLSQDVRDLADLTGIALAAAPNTTDASAWPADIQELADKIDRERCASLGPTEEPVRDRDRQVITRMLPPCVEVSRNDETR